MKYISEEAVAKTLYTLSNEGQELYQEMTAAGERLTAPLLVMSTALVACGIGALAFPLLATIVGCVVLGGCLTVIGQDIITIGRASRRLEVVEKAQEALREVLNQATSLEGKKVA